ALSDVRTELARDDAYTTPERRRALARDVDERWKVIHECFGQYQRLPTFPGEPALQARVDDDLARVRTSIDRALAAPNQTAAHEILAEEVTPISEDASRTLGALIEFNAREAEKMAREIVHLHAAAKTRSLVLLIAVLGATVLL